MTDGWEREWRMVQEQAGAPRPAALGCSTVSHARLGFCSGCLPAHRDHGRHNLGLEVLAWRLLALHSDIASGSEPAPGYVRQLEDAALILWGEMPPKIAKELHDEVPRLVEFLVHLNHAVEHEQWAVRQNVWVENDPPHIGEDKT